jgi:hypothetical protein
MRSDLPPHMNLIAGAAATPTKEEVATQNVLGLDIAMFGYYDRALEIYQGNLLAQHPVIMALFSNFGGRALLYRPNEATIEAPGVPIVYQVLKSTGHSSLAVFEIVGPHIGDAADLSWVAPMQVHRQEQQSALETLDDVAMETAWRDEVRTVLKNNIAYMSACLEKRELTYDEMHAFARNQAPHLAHLVRWAAHTQVEHWMNVMAGWKELLGADFDNAYGVSNSIYVARQNNVLFSVLAQFFGPKAMNSRLLLIETTDFETTPEAMMTALTRVVADRSVGMEFFGNYYLMDYELMGGDGRDAIVEMDKKLGLEEYLPPLIPFGSCEWPQKLEPGPGPGSIAEIYCGR